MEDMNQTPANAPYGKVTISTAEYSDLIGRKTLLEVIMAASGYHRDSTIEAICKAFPELNWKGVPEDA